MYHAVIQVYVFHEALFHCVALSSNVLCLDLIVLKYCIIYIYINIISIGGLFIPWFLSRRTVPPYLGGHIDVIGHVNNFVHIEHEAKMK